MPQGKFISIHDKFLNLAESNKWPDIIKKFGMCSFIAHSGKHCTIETVICIPRAVPEKFVETSLIHLLHLLDIKGLSTVIARPDTHYGRVTLELITGIHIT